MPADFAIRALLPLDQAGNPMQTALADSVEVRTCTTGGWQEIPVPEGASEATLWAVATGAATTIAWIYGGARAGAPVTGATVPTGGAVTAHCAGAPYIYAKASGASCDLMIQWFRKDI